MSSFLNSDKLKLYKEIAELIIRYGNEKELFVRNRDGLYDEETYEKAKKLIEDLQKLGPTFVKIGQLLSTRPDLLPPPFLDELSELQDNLEPFEFAKVEEIIENNIGVRISKAFDEFDEIPIAAASLGRVHKAELKNWRQVAVKIQRAGLKIISSEISMRLKKLPNLLKNIVNRFENSVCTIYLTNFRIRF